MIHMETVGEFLGQWLPVVGENDEAHFLLVALDQGGATLDTIEPSTIEKDKRTAELFEARLLGGARAHCEAAGVPQRYTVICYLGRRAMGQRPIRLEPQAAQMAPYGGDVGELGTHSDRAALGKAELRHLERRFAQLDRAMDGTLASVGMTIERQTRELEHYREHTWKITELAERMASQQAEREREERAAANRDKRMDQVTEMLVAIGKQVAAKYTGADQLSMLLRELPRELLDQIMPVLSEQGRAALVSLLDQAAGAEKAMGALVAPMVQQEKGPGNAPS